MVYPSGAEESRTSANHWEFGSPRFSISYFLSQFCVFLHTCHSLGGLQFFFPHQGPGFKTDFSGGACAGAVAGTLIKV